MQRLTTTRVCRLVLVAVALGAAAVSHALETIRLADDRHIPSQGSTEFHFDLKKVPPGKQVRLGLDARIEWKSLGGSTGGMVVGVNGKGLLGRHLINKPLIFVMRNDSELAWTSEDGSGYRLMYSPDFSDRLKTDESNEYGIPDTDPYRFVWDITSYVRAGDNLVTVNAVKGVSFSLRLRDVSVEIGDPLPPLPKPETAGASAGVSDPNAPLTEYVPKPRREMPTAIAVSSSGDFRFRLGARNFTVRTRTSLPQGKWREADKATETWSELPRDRTSTIQGTATGYSVERQVTLHPDRITVKDTVRNTGAALLGVIVEHRLQLPEKPARTLLAGHVVKRMKRRFSPAHPTALAEFGDLAVGLVAEDDVFRIHAKAFVEDQVLALADPQLGIPPGQAHTLEWSVYAVPDGDYWDFINAIRRNWGVNVTLRGPSTWVHPGGMPSTGEGARHWLASYGRKAKLIVLCNPRFETEEEKALAQGKGGMVEHGPALLLCKHWCEVAANAVRGLKQGDPTVETFIYTHHNLCTEPGHEGKYQDSRAFGFTAYSPPPGLYLPVLNNSYGKALMEVARLIAQRLDANVYIDEITASNVSAFDAYRNAWDGCTAVIDPASHAVTGKRSSAILLMQPWRAALMEYLRSKGKTVIANGPFYTRTMMGWGIQCFVEAGPENAHLSHPLCLTHYSGPPTPARYKAARQLLDQASILFVAFTENAPLFPITPIELRPGVVIGAERILTNRSGWFGWGDASAAEVYVLDGQGKRVQNPDAKEVRQADKLMTELRLPADHLGVLVRRQR